MVPAWARAQSLPCPVPSLGVQDGSSAVTSCASAGNTLAEACAALAPGQAADFPAGAQSAYSEADLAWQTAFYHDDQHGLIHLMGKPANADTSWKHQYYTVATGAWTVVSTGMWDNPGHIYGNMTIDPLTGDVYQVRGGADFSSGRDMYRRAGHWKYSTRAWGYTTNDIYSGAFESHANGVCFHPNLYGPGNGGLIWDTQQRMCFWRKDNGAVSEVSHGFLGEKEGIGEYWPARDKAIIGGADGGALALVSPNGGGTPIVTAVARPPITTAGNSDSGSGGFGSLHVHPGNPDKLMIVERGGSRRVFTSTDGNSWSSAGTHPFTQFPYVVCSLKGNLGALLAVGRSGSSHISKLWKPSA